MRLAKVALPDKLEQFQLLLREADDQAEAWLVASTVPGRLKPKAARAQLARVMLGQVGGEPLEEFLLIPFGEVAIERPLAGRSFVFERKHAEAARRWFEQMGRKLAIDYEHQSFERYNTRPDGLRPAAGWIGRLEIRDDGLWACDVTWTERARELLKSGEYRYFSPAIYWADEDYTELVGLGPVALTNDPAMRGVQPLAASRRPASAANAPERSGDPEAPDAGSPTSPESLAELHAELEAAREEVTLLRRQLAAQEADAFVERGMRLGKIVDSTSMDWREDYLRDPEGAEARLQRAPVVLPAGRVIAVGARGEVISQRRRPRSDMNEWCQRWGIEPEDLEAYDRALAAGRIRRFGAPVSG